MATARKTTTIQKQAPLKVAEGNCADYTHAINEKVSDQFALVAFGFTIGLFTALGFQFFFIILSRL